MNWKLKSINAFLGPIGFIMMGILLIQKENYLAKIIGYVNVFFWSALLLFVLYKFATKKQQ